MQKLVANRIQTPDGTILQSFHRHDYKTHVDSVTGEEYMIDGGLDYCRTNVNSVPAKDLSVYLDSPFEEIREAFCWGTRGKDGKSPLTWKPLAKLDTDHISAILVTQTHIEDWLRGLFQKELDLRCGK